VTADEALLADALAHIDATRHLFATLPPERRAAHLEPEARTIVARLRERLRECGRVEAGA